MAQVIAGVLIIQDGQYVVQKRDDIPTIAEPGMLALWGGAAENDETPIEAGVRELLEETGLSVAVSDLQYVTNYETYGRSPEFIGKKIDVYIFKLELLSDVEINCYEGEGIVRFKNLSEITKEGETPTDFLTTAIELYESNEHKGKKD